MGRGPRTITSCRERAWPVHSRQVRPRSCSKTIGLDSLRGEACAHLDRHDGGFPQSRCGERADQRGCRHDRLRFHDHPITSAAAASGFVGRTFSHQITTNRAATAFSSSPLPSGMTCIRRPVSFPESRCRPVSVWSRSRQRTDRRPMSRPDVDHPSPGHFGAAAGGHAASHRCVDRRFRWRSEVCPTHVEVSRPQ